MRQAGHRRVPSKPSGADGPGRWRRPIELAIAFTVVAVVSLLLMPSFAAATSGQISGTATDASTEAPIEEVWVCAYEAGSGEYGGCAETDASGDYMISGLSTGSYKVYFGGGKYVSRYYNDKASWGEADPVAVTDGATTGNIDAQMVEGGRVEGTVTNASGGAAIEGISVCARASLYDYCASTNASGDYTISALPSGSYKVQFVAGYVCTPTCVQKNYITQYYDGRASWGEADPVPVTAGATTASIDAQMVEGGEITGKVTNASGGAAIEGISVCARVSMYDYGHCAETNASGGYAISALPTGSYKIEFHGPYGSDFLSQYYDGRASQEEADPVPVTAGATTSNIDAQLQEGGRIEGKVTEAAGGTAIEGISVCAKVSIYDYGPCAETNGSGEYTITGLATRPYKIEFSAGVGGGNYLTQYYDGRASWEEADPVPVTAGATTSNIDAQMQEGGRIEGKVTDAVGGEAIEGISVCAKVSMYDYGHCAETNASGEYTISALPTGSYLVRFAAGYKCTPTCTQQNYITQYYDGSAGWEEADPVSVTAGATTQYIDAQMAAGGQITGKVTKAAGGAAISGVYVCAYGGGGMDEFAHCGSTNATGEYTITNLTTASYKVKFSAGYEGGNYVTQYYDGKASWEEADPVSVTAGATTQNIDAQMAVGGQIKGKVTQSGGAAIEGIWVCASGGGEFGGCATTNASGEYAISSLATGSYKVHFAGGIYVPQYYNDRASAEEADSVAVTAGATTANIDAQMQEGGKIEGEVTKAAGGAAAEGTWACAYEGDGSPYEYVGCGSTKASGEYTIEGLATGSYKVKFSGGYGSGNYVTQYYDGKASWEEADPVPVTAGATTSNIDAQMQEGGRIKGNVTKAAGGAAISGVSVCAHGGGGGDEESGGCASTNASGEYTISRLSTGSYKVEFSAGYEGGNYVTQYYDGRASWDEADPVSVTAGATTQNIDAQMAAGGRIKGTVTKASGGAAIAGASICAYRPGAEEPDGCTNSNFSGSYTIARLGAGSYQVEFGPGYSCEPGPCAPQNYVRQFYDNKLSRDEAELVGVTAGATHEEINAALQTGGEISGHVTDALSGEPVLWSSVCAYRSGEEGPESCGESDSDGSYVIAGLSGGSHEVEFGPGYSCGLYTCTENSYSIQFYDDKPSLATADPVNVTVEEVQEGIDAALSEPSVSKPINTAPPQLTGTPVVGQTLTCSKGTWTNTNSSTSWASTWLRDGTPISGQSGSTYVVQSADAGHGISCQVTATNDGGSGSALSNTVQVPAAIVEGGGGPPAPEGTTETPPVPKPKGHKCKKGYKKKKIKGKVRCVKLKHRKHH